VSGTDARARSARAAGDDDVRRRAAGEAGATPHLPPPPTSPSLPLSLPLSRLDQYYYVFGFLLLVYALLLITCAEISIVLTYFQLCAEDYRWWWRSMLAPGASGVYLYAYCIFYYMANLEVTGWVSQLLYFGYMGLVACVFTFITGATGFLATFWFVRTIYSAIKVRNGKRRI